MNDTLQIKTALLLDDNRANLLVIQQELLHLGFMCKAINSPARLEATLDEMAYIDIIFLDLEMPAMDGYEVLEILKKRLNDVPIVAHTVHTDQLPKIRQAGFSGMIGKPLDVDNFAAALEMLLAGKAVWLSN